jgi:hypothetical protein
MMLRVRTIDNHHEMFEIMNSLTACFQQVSPADVDSAS